MILVAITPCSAAGCLGVTLADCDDAGSLLYLGGWTAPVGELVPLPAPIARGSRRAQTLTRELSLESAASLARVTVERLPSESVEWILIERPHGAGKIAQRAATMMLAIQRAAAVAEIIVKVVEPVGGYNEHPDQRRLAVIVGWPKDATETERRAALLLLPRKAESDGVSGDRIHRDERGGVAGVPGDDRPRELGDDSTGVVSVETPAPIPGEMGDAQPMGSAEDTAPVDPSPPKLAPRLLAYDPGSVFNRAIVVEGLVAPFKFIAPFRHDYGHAVIKANGAKGRSFTDADTFALVAKLEAFALHHSIDRLIIERVEHIIPFETVAATQAKGTQIARANHIAGVVLGTLVARGLEAYPSVSATEARKRAKLQKKKRADTRTKSERIHAAVVEVIPDWPFTSDNHEQDCGILVRYAGVLWEEAIGEEVVHDAPAVANVPRAPRQRTKSQDAVASQKRADAKKSAERAAARRAARAAQGCGCPTKTHRRDCPLFIPQAQARDIMDFLRCYGSGTRANVCDFGSKNSDLRERALDMLVAQGDVAIVDDLYRIAPKAPVVDASATVVDECPPATSSSGDHAPDASEPA